MPKKQRGAGLFGEKQGLVGDYANSPNAMKNPTNYILQPLASAQVLPQVDDQDRPQDRPQDLLQDKPKDLPQPPYNSDTDGPVTTGPGQEGGAPKCKKTHVTTKIGNLTRCIYEGPRGGKYVKMEGDFVPLKDAQKKAAAKSAKAKKSSK